MRKYSEAYTEKEPKLVGYCEYCKESFVLDVPFCGSMLCPNNNCFYILRVETPEGGKQ